ncbi:SHD1 domain-containing protein [Pontiellaceae bacterium B12219]|nr:SHD1 domain-containing protein [Pontiellaceae bacterium B12219]
MIRNALFLSVFSLLIVHIAQAELRVWTDKNGKTIEAEHVRTLTNTVVLRRVNGSEIRISLDTLSERDRRYAILQTPPRIDISVASDTDRSNTGYGGRRSVQVQEESVSVEVKVRKSSSAPYEAPLRAEIYLIGSPENKEGYIILDKRTERFFFSAQNGNQHVIQSREIKLRQIESGRQVGVEYKGYLVAIIDKSNEILQMKCSKLDYEKNAAAIMAGETGTMFDSRFEVVNEKKAMRTPGEAPKKPIAGRRF